MCYLRLSSLFALLLMAQARAEPGSDLLIYGDGDKLRGTLISNDGTTVVFRSTRFGVLTVPCSQASVLSGAESAKLAAEKGTTPPSQAQLKPETTKPEEEKKADNSHWQGYVSVAADFERNLGRERTYVTEVSATKTWKRDKVEFKGRYEFARDKDSIGTDLLKLNGDWRHDITKSIFSLYRPTVEANQAFTIDNQPADYVLAQQELGAGHRLQLGKWGELRGGFSGIHYDVWTVYQSTHYTKALPAAFGEAELKLTKKITFRHRGIWYYPFNTRKDGYEAHAEIDRKITEKLHLAFSHDIRHNSPDMRLEDDESYHLQLRLDY